MIISSFRVRLGLILFFTLSSLSATFGFQNYTDYVITNTNASGAGSLNDVLSTLDGQSGAHRITFDSSLAGQRIPYTVYMATVGDTLIIDGDVNGDDVADVTLDGQGMRAGWQNNRPNAYLVLRNLNFDSVYSWYQAQIFQCRNVANMVVENCSFTNYRGEVFVMSGYPDDKALQLTVNNCKFINSLSWIGAVYGGFGSGVNSTFTNIEIRGTTASGGNPAALFRQFSGTLAIQNALIHDNESHYLLRADGYSADTPSEIKLTHVTMANNQIIEDITVPFGLFTVRVGNIVFENSLLAGNLTNKGASPSISTTGQGTYSLNNCVIDTALAGYFTNPAMDDYTLADNSPAIDAGNLGLVGGLTTDLLGNPRPSNGLSPDLGAYEKQSGTTGTTYTVLNTLAAGAGSLNDILDQIHQQAGEHYIVFDSSLAGQTIPWNRDLFLLGSLYIAGDLDGDGQSDITLTSSGQAAGITTDTQGLVIDLQYLTFDNFKGSQNGPQVISMNHQGRMNIEGCSFLNSEDTWLLLSHPTDTMTLMATDVRFEGNSDDNVMAYMGNGFNIEATFTNCIAQNNIASDGNSRLFYALSSDFTMDNGLITDNFFGRGITLTSANVNHVPVARIVHTTLANNDMEPVNGYGAIVSSSGNIFLHNSLVVANNDTTGTDRNLESGSIYGTITQAGSVVDTLLAGYFVDAANQDYHLAPSSPAIAVGLDSLVGASLDLEGNVRPTVGTRPDAGAYELGVASLLVTNAQASGSGSLNQILSQLQRADGNYTIQFDPSLKGQNIPFEESWELGLGSYTLNGDVEGDQVADITLQGYATPGSFSFTAAGTTLNLKYLNFDSIGTTNQSTPPVISSSTSGKIFIEGCSFSNIATGIMSVSPTTDTLSIVVSNSRFQNNQNEFAGIIFANRAAAQVQFSNCIIQNNVLLEYANALFYMLSGRLTFENCLISDNVGDWIIYNTGNTVFEPGTLVVRHTTITNNTVEHNAIGLGDGGLELYNSLVVGNYSDTVALNVEPTGTFLANGSLFQGSAEGIFTDLLGGNYTLSDSSRAIDIGDPNEVGTLTTDLAGNPRPNGLPDAGAYESSVILHPVVTEVNLLVTNANPSGPGSFADAIASVNGQSDNFIISFDPSLAGQTIPYHTDTVMLAGSLTINGDVDGNNTSDIILDGVACQGVIFSVDNDITLRLRHLKFQDFEGLCGVAMFWIRNQGSIITESCEFVNLQRPVFKIENWTDNFPTHLTITDSRFTNLFGGGVFQSSSTEESTVTLRNCIIEKAFSPRGYLLWWSREQVTMENCLIVDNQVENLVYATGRSSSLVMRHCTIANNLVDPSFFDPGAIYAYIGTLSFYNTLLVGNTNSDDGTEETYSTRGSQTVLSTGGSILSGGSAGYFIDASQNDFTLAVNSPAIDAGDLALVGTLTTDLAGTPRPVSLPDVGAYEVTGTPAAPVVDSALVVSLSLDTCGGTIVTDAITSETVGALVGGTTRTAGYQGQGLRFDGVDDQVVLFDSTYDLTTGDGLSYSVWVYPTRKSEHRETLIERVAAPVSSVLSLEFGEPIFYLGGLNNAYWIKADTLLPLNQWSQIVATYANGTARMYLNGALVREQSGLTGTLNFGPGNHVLGLRGDNTRGFAGSLDEVRIFNYALTATEANSEATRLSFSPTVCMPVPTAQYGFSECSGTSTADEAGSNDGTLVGASFSTGYEGTGLTFDGNDYVNLGSNSELDFTTAFTFAAWVNTSQVTGRRVIAIDNPNGSNWSYAVSLLNSQPELGLGSGVTVPFPLRLNTNIADGTWHHLAFTFGQGTVTGYVDGVQNAQWKKLPGAIIPNLTTDVWLGGRSGKNRFFAGSMDEVQLYAVALSADEISTLASLSQNSSDCASPRMAWSAMADETSTSWEIYPNPTQGRVTLRSETPFGQGTTLRVTNTLGQIILSKPIPEGTYEVLLSELRHARPGLYYISLFQPGGQQVKTLQIR